LLLLKRLFYAIEFNKFAILLKLKLLLKIF
jgi:hypothetical protein